MIAGIMPYVSWQVNDLLALIKGARNPETRLLAVEQMQVCRCAAVVVAYACLFAAVGWVGNVGMKGDYSPFVPTLGGRVGTREAISQLISPPPNRNKTTTQFIRTKLTVHEASSVLDEAMKHFGWRAGACVVLYIACRLFHAGE